MMLEVTVATTKKEGQPTTTKQYTVYYLKGFQKRIPVVGAHLGTFGGGRIVNISERLLRKYALLKEP